MLLGEEPSELNEDAKLCKLNDCDNLEFINESLVTCEMTVVSSRTIMFFHTSCCVTECKSLSNVHRRLLFYLFYLGTKSLYSTMGVQVGVGSWKLLDC